MNTWLTLSILLITTLTAPILAAPDYVLAPGDELEISLYDRADSIKLLSVDPQGTISYPGMPRIKAAGKTIPALTRDLKAQLGLLLNNPQVSIIPVDFKSRHYTITGAVNAPGRYVLPGSVRVLDLIGQAKGLKTNLNGEFAGLSAADLDHTLLLRNNTYVPVNFTRLVETGMTSENRLLMPGDSLFVPEKKTKSLTVLGEVSAPGLFDINGPTTLVQALVKAKGFNSKGDRGSVVILRGSLSSPTTIRVDVSRIMNAQDPDVVLQDKDLVYVPKRGSYELEELLRLAVNTFIQAYALTDVSTLFNNLPMNKAQ